MKSAFLLGLLMASVLAPAAGAGDQDMPDAFAQIDLLPGWRDADGRHHAALSIRLAPGWKTYWRTPGDAGIPPVLVWEGSENISGVEMVFPVPDVLDQNGMRSIGYHGDVVLPLIVRATDPASDMLLKGRMSIGVCNEICVPVDIDVRATLPRAATREDPVIRAALEDQPMTEAEAAVSGVGCEIAPIDDGLRLTARIAMPRIGGNEVAVVELPDRRIWISEADVRRENGTLVAEADLVPPDARPFALARGDIRITVIADGRAVDIQGCS